MMPTQHRSLCDWKFWGSKIASFIFFMCTVDNGSPECG